MAVSHAVSNTLTEDFQDAFKKWQKCCKQYTYADGDYFEGDGSQ
jgi:hypothetical protein